MTVFTVRDLIKELQTYPENAKIIVLDGQGMTREAYYTELTNEGVRIG